MFHGRKPSKRAGQREHQDRRTGGAGLNQDDGRPTRRDGAHARSQAVHVVEDVDRMNDGREPDHGEHDERRREDTGRGLVEQIDQHRAKDKRTYELGGGPERKLVVNEAKGQPAEGRADKHDGARLPSPEQRQPLPTVPAAMATPPSRGVGLRCHRSLAGRLTIPSNLASVRQADRAQS